jgi:hypothetical protein
MVICKAIVDHLIIDTILKIITHQMGLGLMATKLRLTYRFRSTLTMRYQSVI